MDKKKKLDASLAVVKTLKEFGLREPEAIEVLIMTLDGTYASMQVSYEIREKSPLGTIASLLEYICKASGDSEEDGEDGD